MCLAAILKGQNGLVNFNILRIFENKEAIHKVEFLFIALFGVIHAIRWSFL